MTKELFVEYCNENDLNVVFQKVFDWGEKDLDCISIFEKPAINIHPGALAPKTGKAKSLAVFLDSDA